MQKKRLFYWLVALVLFSVFISYAVWGRKYFSLVYIQGQKNEILAMVNAYPVIGKLLFWLLYFFVAAASLPAAGLLTVFAGFLFGAYTGVLLVITAATIGSAISFLLARNLLRERILASTRYRTYINQFDVGLSQNGILYLFFLRLVPIFPFFLVNIIAGISPIRFNQYLLISFLGMLPATVLYVKLGQQLSSIQSLSQLLSPDTILLFTLIGVFPIAMKRLWGKVLGKI